MQPTHECTQWVTDPTTAVVVIQIHCRWLHTWMQPISNVPTLLDLSITSLAADLITCRGMILVSPCQNPLQMC